jgi:hypothetical protein
MESCSRNTTTNWSGHTHLGERSTLLCPKGDYPGRPSDGAPCETPTLRDQLQRPSGPPDHISYPKLASLHLSQDSSPISRNLYSKRYFPVMGGSSPLSICFPLTVTFHTSPSILSLSSDPTSCYSLPSPTLIIVSSTL